MASLASMVKKVCPDFIAWSSQSSQSSQGSPPAIERTFGIISRLLVLETESGGLKVGDLIIALLRRAPDHVSPVLPDLLRAMVTRLAHAQTASFAQSLILPFAFLLRDEQNAGNVLALLEEMRVSQPAAEEGGSAAEVSGLEVLMAKWVENAETFQGHWAQKTSTLALTRLLSPPSGAAARPSLDGISVRGDALPDVDAAGLASGSGTPSRIRTRSRAKAAPTQYTTVPLPVKLLKVLLAELASAMEGEGPGAGAGQARVGGGLMGGSGLQGDADDDDDEDGEWDDEDDGDVPLSQLLSMDPDALAAAAGEDGDSDGLDEEEDAKRDEAYKLDVRTYLSKWLQGLLVEAQQQQQERARALLEGLNEGEKKFLGRVVA